MTKPTHSPFYVIQDFISPLKTEEIIDSLNCLEPDTDTEGFALMNQRRNEQAEEEIFHITQDHIEGIEKHYGVGYRAMEKVVFEWYPHGYVPNATDPKNARCENSTYVKKEGKKGGWVRNRDRDLSCILFLSDYNDDVPFDSEYEVYGGKLEYPQHQFGFNPQRGTLIVYPSGPHFLNIVADVGFGDSFLARFHLATQEPFMYNPKEFPGDYTSWLEQFA